MITLREEVDGRRLGEAYRLSMWKRREMQRGRRLFIAKA